MAYVSKKLVNDIFCHFATCCVTTIGDTCRIVFSFLTKWLLVAHSAAVLDVVGLARIAERVHVVPARYDARLQGVGQNH
jgi:hypothetical protein